MADEFDDDLTGDDLVKDLRRQIKALSKEKADLTGELSQLKSGARERFITDTLTAKGVSPKVAKFIPSDVTDEDGVAKWLEENADVFGVQATGATTDTPPVDSEQVAAAKRLQTLNQAGQSPAKLADLNARIANATSEKELNELFAEAKRFIL